MEQRIGTREFIVMMSMITALTAMAIDFMSPAFGEIREHFGLGASSTSAALIITVFFLGEVSQVLFGPLSDRFGRLPILRAGFLIYAVSAIASTFAPSFSMMLVARFIWGLGAAALQVSANAIIRDRYRGNEMARVLSIVMSIFLIVPILAPVAGAALLSVSSWRLVFSFPAVLALGVFLWSLRLAESRPESNKIALEFGAIARAFRHVASNRTTVRYTVGSLFLFAAFSSFLSSFERVIGEIYGRPTLFPYAFAGIASVTAVVMVVNSRLVTRFGTRPTVIRQVTSYLVGAAVYLVLTVAADGVPRLAVTIIALSVVLTLNTASSVNFGALALEPMGEQAGIAASAYGSIYVGGGALLGSLIDRQLTDSITPWAMALLASAVMAFLLVPAKRHLMTEVIELAE